MLGKAGFREMVQVPFGQTRSPFPEIVMLDNREAESFFVEAVR